MYACFCPRRWPVPGVGAASDADGSEQWGSNQVAVPRGGFQR